MTVAAPRKFSCVRCSRPRAEVEGMVAVQHGGYPVQLCFACVDDLKLAADEARTAALEAEHG